MNRFAYHYSDIVRPELIDKYPVKNKLSLPKFNKVVISVSSAAVVADKKVLSSLVAAIELLSGRRPCISVARKSVASFKLRRGMVLGCKVTLQGDAMYSFLDRFGTIALPRTKDFRGYTCKKLDSNGNISFGVKDFFVFPEVEFHYEKFDRAYGFNVTLVSNSGEDTVSFSLCSLFRIPLVR